MPSPAPQSRFDAFDCTGVLNEWLDPQRVGGKGLTSCTNLIYHREGTWGKRPGASQILLPSGGSSSKLSSGFRWYRVYPNSITQLFVWAQNQLLVGNGPNNLAPVTSGGNGAISLTTNIAPDFCSMRDPQSNLGNGADICIIAGLTLAKGSYGTGTITIVGLPSASIATNASISITVKNNGTNVVTTANYQVLPTDNPSSIASQLCILLNETGAYLNGAGGVSFAPYLGITYYTTPNPQQPANANPNPQAIIHLGAAHGGSPGNNITFSVTAANLSSASGNPMSIVLTGQTTATLGPNGSTGDINFSGGGNSWSGPMRYDPGNGTLEGLSYMASNPFTGCCTWHDHLWLWGDAGNPDTVFACDINQPEAFTFMAQNGGMNGPANQNNTSINGGYNIGPGDGDPAIQACVPNGNALYVFKTENIYQISGYDFQQGEYAFSVTPQVVGYGIPSRDAVDVLEGQYVFWSGKKFLRLAVGAYEPEHIGLPVAIHEGLASNGKQNVVKVVAGDFQVETLLVDRYSSPSSPPPQTILLRSVAMFVVDTGDGHPDTIMVYDDEKTGVAQQYAWSIWKGWTPGCFIKYGLGSANSGGQDAPLLFFVDQDGSHIYQVGADAADDWGNPIPWQVQSGWIDFGTPEMIKNIHEFYLRVATTAGSTFSVTCIPSQIVPPPGQTSQFSTTPVTFTFAPSLAPTNCEALNDLKSFIQAALQTQAAIVQVNEPGTAMSGFELVSFGIDANPQEAYQT